MLLACISCEEKKQVFTNDFGVTCTVIEAGTELLKDSLVMGNYRTVIIYTGSEITKKNPHQGPVFYQPVSFEATKDHPVFSLLKGRHVGDSLEFHIPYNDKTRGLLPPNATDSTSLKFFVRITEAITIEEYRAQEEKKQEEQIAKLFEEHKDQFVAIEKYLGENGLADKAKKLPSGMYIVVNEEKGGVKPQNGQMVQVEYTGNVLNNPEPFDSSVGKGQPFAFALGQQQVITGWDLGIAELGVGDKATLFIPSYLGYGPRGSGERIPPNSILKFEVELTGIDAAKGMGQPR